MIITRMYIEEGGKIPFGYGVSYYNFNQSCVVCYPIPLNNLISVARQFYYALVRKTGRWDRGIRRLDLKKQFDGAVEVRARVLAKEMFDKNIAELFEKLSKID